MKQSTWQSATVLFSRSLMLVILTISSSLGVAQSRSQDDNREGNSKSSSAERNVGNSSKLDRQAAIQGIPPLEHSARMIDETELTRSDEKLIDSSVVLPNTMDGLNDKRPLGIGDRLSFKVVEDEGPARTLVVTDSGEIDVPYIGRVAVGNRTCKQFAIYVKRLLEREFYFQATVIVGLDSVGSGARAASRGKVYVMGQVRSQGPQEIPIDEVLTVSKAILRAGGFGPYANKKKVRLVRGGKSNSTLKPIIIDCVEILDKGKSDADVEIKPDDVITVPEKLINIF